MRPCSHPGSSAYGNTSLSITVTDGTWVTVGPQDNMQTPMETWDYGSESGSRSVVSDSLQPHGLYSPWNSQGQNTGVGSLSLLQGIFPTQELNQCLLHCRRTLYQLSYQGSPRLWNYQILIHREPNTDTQGLGTKSLSSNSVQWLCNHTGVTRSLSMVCSSKC